MGIGIALGAIVGLAAGTLFGGLFLFVSTRLVARFEPSFGAACKVALLATLSNGGIGLLAGTAARAMGLAAGMGLRLAMVLVGWLVYSAFVARFIRHPQTGPLGYRRAMLISLVAGLMSFLTVAAVYFAFAMLRR